MANLFLRRYKQVVYFITGNSNVKSQFRALKINEAIYKSGRHLVMVSYIKSKPPGIYAFLGSIYFLLACRV